MLVDPNLGEVFVKISAASATRGKKLRFNLGSDLTFSGAPASRRPALLACAAVEVRRVLWFPFEEQSLSIDQDDFLSPGAEFASVKQACADIGLPLTPKLDGSDERRKRNLSGEAPMEPPYSLDDLWYALKEKNALSKTKKSSI